MAVIPCPNQDGDCSFPERALLFSGGQFSVLTAGAAERLSYVDEVDELEPIDLGDMSYDEVVDMILDARRGESPYWEDSFAQEAGERAAALEDSLRSFADKDIDYVIVNCAPCGHRFKKRVDS